MRLESTSRHRSRIRLQYFPNLGAPRAPGSFGTNLLIYDVAQWNRLDHPDLEGRTRKAPLTIDCTNLTFDPLVRGVVVGDPFQT